MKHEALEPVPCSSPDTALDLARVMQRVAVNSARPRYTFMVLDLISRAAGDGGRAGPYVRDGEALVPIREWLCDAIQPIASRHHRRLAITEEVRRSLKAVGDMPDDPAEAERALDDAVRDRVRASGMTAISRAVSELVKAGLLKRHYQGFRVDHVNRGAQRQAVYTVPPSVRDALDGRGRQHAPRLI